MNFISTKLKVHSLSFFLVLVCVVGVFTLPAHAADANDIYNLLNNTTNTYLNTIKNSNAQIESKASSIYSDIHTYLPTLDQIAIYDRQISEDIIKVRNSIINSNGVINSGLSSIVSNTSSTSSNVSLIRTGLNNTLPDIHDSVVQLQEVLASDEDLAIRQAQAQRVDQINDDFLSSSGDASVSLGDLGSAKDSVGALKGALSGGASASSLWDIFDSSSSAWGWFSQATADDLDQAGLSLQGEVSYSYLNDYYNEVGLSLGGEYND